MPQRKSLNSKQYETIKNLLLENKKKMESVLNSINNEQQLLSDMVLNDEGDFAIASRDYSTDINIKQKQIKELNQINYTLEKMNNNTYTGLCEMCDAPIAMARLKIKPHAKYCIDCREFMDKEKRA